MFGYYPFANRYHLTYRFHNFMRVVYKILLYCGVIAVAVLIGSAQTNKFLRNFDQFTRTSFIFFACLLLLISILWLAIGAWYSVTFRYLAWWVSLGIGRLRYWLFDSWGRYVLVFVMTLFLSWLYSHFFGNAHSLFEFLSPSLLVQVLTVSAVILVFIWVYRLGQRIVIMPCTDYTNNESIKAFVSGLGVRFLDELMRIIELYQTVSQTSPFEPTITSSSSKEGFKTQAVEATIDVADVGQTLQSIVQDNSVVGFGLLTIPINTLLGILGRIIEGPKLTISLHREGNQYVLVANLQGGGRKDNWRVRQDDLPPTSDSLLDEQYRVGDNDTQLVTRLCVILAYQVFSTLVKNQLGSPNWRAIYYFTQGLRAYRPTSRTRLNWQLNLHTAERDFIQALAQDDQFNLCHYNLGIIYYALGNLDSAQASFERAIGQDSTLSEAYYALAKVAQARNKPENVIRHCRQVIALSPDDERAWNLTGTVMSYSEKYGLGDSVTVEMFSISTALAWRRLCQEAIGGGASIKQKNSAMTCTRNLAISEATARQGLPAQIMQQAMSLQPNNPDLYVEKAKMHVYWQDGRRALQSFYRALEITNVPSYWIWIANIHSSLADLNRRALGQSIFVRLFLVLKRPSYYRSLLGNNADEHEREADTAWRHASNWIDDVISIQEALDYWKRVSSISIDFPKTIKLTKDQQTLIKEKTKYLFRYYLRNPDNTPEWWKWLQASTEVVDRLQKLQQKPLDTTDNRLTTIDEIEKEFSDKVGELHDWLTAQLAFQRAIVRLDIAQNSKLVSEQKEISNLAVEGIEQAISLLENEHNREIQYKSMYGSLAHAYLLQERLDMALFAAERAVSINSGDAWAHLTLGLAYLKVQDYDRAESEFEQSVALDPTYIFEVSQQRVFLLSSRILTAQQSEARQRIVRKITLIIREILESTYYEDLSDKNLQSQIEGRSWANFWLGRFYGEQRDYEKAIRYVQIAVNMGYKPLEARIVIAWAYLKLSAFEQAERAFREAGIEALKQAFSLKTKHVGLGRFDHFSDASGEERPIIMRVMQIYLWSSFGLAEQGVNVRKAQRRAKYVTQQLHRCRPILLQQYSDHPFAKQIQDELLDLEATVHANLGWIHFRAGQLAPRGQETYRAQRFKEATRQLERAISITQQPDTYVHAYVHLARVYVTRAEYEKVKRDYWLSRAREAYRRTYESDIQGEYRSETKPWLDTND